MKEPPRGRRRRSSGCEVFSEVGSSADLPPGVRVRETDAARPKAGGNRIRFVGEENAVSDVSTASYRLERGPAVEPPVDPTASMPAERARPGAVVRLSISAEELPGTCRCQWLHEKQTRTEWAM